MAETFYRVDALVCAGTGCVACGGMEVFEALKAEIARQGLENEVQAIITGCRGFCEVGPLMIIYPEGIFYCRVKERDIPHLVEETFLKGRVVEALTYKEPVTHQALPHYSEIPFYGKQQRIVLSNCGIIDPEKIEEYIAQNGYEALGKAILEMKPEDVIEEIKRSGLRGRGGAGFTTGLKWEFTHRAPGKVKYVVCNADEGDPGAFMNRSVLEGDPHRVLEGMIIAAYAIGARQGYIYVRAEYPLALTRLRKAIDDAKQYGLMGKEILGSDFSCEIDIVEGAGAFVCGEETAMMAAMEGRRGMPRQRPPFPAISGLRGRPTVINNVETLAHVPGILLNGVDWFRSFGTPTNPGTKTFALTGKVNNTGLVEIPLGLTMRELIFDIGGGIQGGKTFKAVQIGGPSGGCLTETHLDYGIDYESLTSAGAMMGSGGLVVLNEDDCMVEMACFFMTFTQNESCGKCVMCREGTMQMLEILTDITQGKGEPDDIERLLELAKAVKAGSLCALGKTTPNPVFTTIKYFRPEYEAHINEKECPARVCKGLISFYILPDKCKGCMSCIKACPVNAIQGERKATHIINQEECIRCGICLDACPPKFKAITKLPGNLTKMQVQGSGVQD